MHASKMSSPISMHATNNAGGCTRASVQVVPAAKETPAQRYARQLRELMARHSIETPAEMHQMLKRKGYEQPDTATIWRIREGKAKTSPRRETLERLADACGETLAQAFPEPGQEPDAVIEFEGVKIALKSFGGPMSPSMLRRFLTQHRLDQAVATHEAKTKHRRRREDGRAHSEGEDRDD